MPRLPEAQRAVLAWAADHPTGRLPERATVHPATWMALLDRFFIAGEPGQERITNAGRQALASGRTIEVISIWAMRWACTAPGLCHDRRSGFQVYRPHTSLSWFIRADGELFQRPIRLSDITRETALREATARITHAQRELATARQ